MLWASSDSKDSAKCEESVLVLHMTSFMEKIFAQRTANLLRIWLADFYRTCRSF